MQFIPLMLIKKADLGISDFVVEKRKLRMDEKLIEFIGLEEEDRNEVRFKHNDYSLNLRQESDGTKGLFGLSGLILPILKEGGILFFDELCRSIHPDLLVYIVKLFHNPEINKGNAQLVFTTHNDILLDKFDDDLEEESKKINLFRRDQIWFTAKTVKEQKTELYSLVEFAGVRDEHSLVNRYREGQFGARPALQEFYWND